MIKRVFIVTIVLFVYILNFNTLSFAEDTRVKNTLNIEKVKTDKYSNKGKKYYQDKLDYAIAHPYPLIIENTINIIEKSSCFSSTCILIVTYPRLSWWLRPCLKLFSKKVMNSNGAIC